MTVQVADKSAILFRFRQLLSPGQFVEDARVERVCGAKLHRLLRPWFFSSRDFAESDLVSLLVKCKLAENDAEAMEIIELLCNRSNRIDYHRLYEFYFIRQTDKAGKVNYRIAYDDPSEGD